MCLENCLYTFEIEQTSGTYERGIKTRSVDLWIIHEILSCLNDGNVHLGVLCQSCGYTETRGATANDDVVILLVHEVIHAAESGV